MTDHNQWDACPTGLVTKMARELRDRQFRDRLRPVIAGVAIVLVLAVAWAFQGNGGPGVNPLTCAETVPLLAAYHNDALDPAVTTRVAGHLANCPSCRKHYQDRFPGEASLAEDLNKLVASGASFVVIDAGSVLLAAR